MLIDHKQDFRRLNDSYECIIINNANLQEFEETKLLSIIENQTGKSIRVLYHSVIKKAHIVQMIAMNRQEFKSISYLFRQPRFARRILLFQPNIL